MSQALLTAEELREAFREWMRKHDCNITSACVRLGISGERPHVSEFLSGNRYPPPRLLEALGYVEDIRYRKAKRK